LLGYFGFIQPGDYEAVTTQTNARVNHNPGIGISNVVAGQGRCTFTVADMKSVDQFGATFGVGLTATNTSGSPIDITDFRVNLVSEASQIAPGNAFRQAYVDAHRGAKSIRLHDFGRFDSTGSVWARYFSDFNQNINKRAYSGDAGTAQTGINNGLMPIAVQCELPRRAGARPWFNMHTGMGRMGYNYDHASDSFYVYRTNPEDGTGITVPHRLVEGEKVRSFPFDINLALTPLGNHVDMFVKNATLNGGKAFQLSATKFGPVVAFPNSAPITTPTGNIAAGSLVITGITGLANVGIGSIVRSSHLPDGFGIVQSIDSVSQVTLQDLFTDNGGNNYRGQITAASGTPITFNGNLGFLELRYSTMASMDVDVVADMIRPEMQAIKAAWPTGKPMFEPSNENWNSGFPSFHWFHDIASVLAGNTNRDHSQGMAWFILLMWKTAEEVFGAGNFTIVHPGQGQFFGNLGNSFNYVDPGIRRAGVTLQQQYIDALASDTNPDIPSVVYAFAMYLGGADSTIPGSFNDVFNGQLLADAYADNGNTTNIPDSYWDGRFNAEIQWKTGTVPADLAAVKAVVPNIKMTAYEWGHQLASAVRNDNEYLAAINLQTYLDGPAGAAMYQRFWNQVIAPHANDWYTLNHFSGYGGRTLLLNHTFYSWPICGNDLTDNFRSAWYKTV
jgi:hypothetical protein